MPAPAAVPVVFPYQRALDEFRREGREPPLLKRMSELISLLDLTVTLDSGLSRREILDSALLIVMGELQISRGGLFVRTEDGSFRLDASRGLPADPPTLDLPGIVSGEPVLRGAPGLLPFDLEIVCPISKTSRSGPRRWCSSAASPPARPPPSRTASCTRSCGASTRSSRARCSSSTGSSTSAAS